MTRENLESEDFEFIKFEDTAEEELTGENCPICGYPIVIEGDLEVCYCCGWYKGCEEEVE